MSRRIRKLAQVITLEGDSTKASLYLKPSGCYQSGTFDFDSGIAIDSANYYNITESTFRPMLDKDSSYSGFTGPGYIIYPSTFFSSGSSNDYSILNYPISGTAGTLSIYVRYLHSGSGTWDMELYIDGEQSGGTYNIADSAVWAWAHVTDITVDASNILGVKICTRDAAIDQIALGLTPAGGDPAYDLDNYDAPYVTCHLLAAQLNGLQPASLLPIHDSISTYSSIKGEGWHDFDLTHINSSSVITWPSDTESDIALVLASSGATLSNYVNWYYNDEGTFEPASTNNNADWSSPWTELSDVKYLYKLWESRDSSLNTYGGITIDPPEDINETNPDYVITDFDSSNAENNKNVTFQDTPGSISLSPQGKLVAFIVDNSGSMTWNDSEDNRIDMINGTNKLIDRLEGSGLPFEYLIYSYSGKEIDPIFGGARNTYNPFAPNYNSQKIFPSDQLVDRDSNFFGVRVLRREDYYPTSPIDGEIVKDGVFNRLLEDNKTVDQDYYYSIYTFDSDYKFSDPVNIKITPRSANAPSGISNFRYKELIGSGVVVDNDVVSVWHMDENEESTLYDFVGNLNLTLTDTTWIGRDNVPIGEAGLKLLGSSTASYASAVDSSGLLCLNNQLTIMGWIRLRENTGSDEYIIGRTDGVNVEYAFYYDNGELKFRTTAGTVNSSSLVWNTDDEWYHVAVTYNAITQSGSFYRNGINIGDFSGLDSSSISSATVYIGTLDPSSDYFDGSITEVSVHSAVRSSSYILDAYDSADNRSDFDNGDRLLVFNYDVLTGVDYIGGDLRVVEKEFSAPSWENDGDIIYTDLNLTAGSYEFTHREDFVLGETYNFRLFTEKSNTFSHIDDSVNLSIPITNISENARQYLPSTTRNGVSDCSITVGNAKNYINWTTSIINNDAKRIYIYYDFEDYPNVDNFNYTGTKAGVLDITEEGFVHRGLKNRQYYYYSIFSIDRYGRVSNVSHVRGQPSSANNDDGIPLVEVENVRYELIDSDTYTLIWDKLPDKRIINSYFDDEVILYVKLLDKLGSEIDDDDVLVDLSVTADVTVVDNASANIFEGITGDFSAPTTSSLYRAEIFDMEDSLSEGILKIRFSTSGNNYILTNIDAIDFSIRATLYKQDDDGNTIFSYQTDEIEVRMLNPLDIKLFNLHNKFIDVSCYETQDALDGSYFAETKRYNGSYINASSDFVLRTIISYKDLENVGPTSVKAAVLDADLDLCSSDSVTILDDIESLDFTTQTINVQTKEIDVIDNNGISTGTRKKLSYADISVSAPSEPAQYVIYVMVQYGGVRCIKKLFITFESTLKIELNPNIPLANGSDVLEQFANVYIIDPDDPNNISKRSYPVDNTIVKWSLTPTSDDFPERNIYSDDGITQQTGVLSYVTDGIADNVWFGPINSVQLRINDEGQIERESHYLKASVAYNGITAVDQRKLLLASLGEDGLETSTSHVLMEFPNLKQKFYTNGRSYARMLVSHNPNTSTSLYADCFRTCMSDIGKTIYTLDDGQSIFITSDESELEIIWGDVIEYVDPYTGEWLLDTSNAQSDTGSAFAQLDTDDDYTYIYFRLDKDYPSQQTIGTSKSEPTCSCVRDNEYINYNDEIIISCNLLKVSGTDSIDMSGGGGMDSALIPTVLIPQNTLDIKLVGRRCNGSIVQDLVVDGTSSNELIFEVTNAGVLVPEGTPVTAEVVNIRNNVISLLETKIYTVTKVDTDIDDLNEKSYVSFYLEPIPVGSSFLAHLQVSSSLTLSGSSKKTDTLCVKLEYTSGGSSSEGLFSPRNDQYDTGLSSWVSKESMDDSRAHVMGGTVSNKAYVIGGVDGSSILSRNEEYDSTTDSWASSLKEEMPTARMAGMSAVDTVNNLIYVMGGVVYSDSNAEVSLSTAVEAYDPSTDTWSIMSDLPYGIAFGCGYYYSGYIYIFSGIKKISDDGLTTIHNDKVLIYDISNDSWDMVTVASYNLDLYRRISPVCFLVGTDVYVTTGVKQNNDQSIQYLTTTYACDVSSPPASIGIRDASEDLRNDLPRKYKAAYVEDAGNAVYVSGGSSKTVNFLRDFSYIDTSVGIPLYIDTSIPNADALKGRTGAKFYNGSGGYYLIGGISSSKSEYFLKINAQSYPTSMTLNGEQAVDIYFKIEDDSGQAAPDGTEVHLKGYLQFSSVSGSLITNIKRSLSKQKVLFDSTSFTTTNGEGFATLIARSSDFIEELMDSISFISGQENIEYQIIVQATIYDNNYIGQNPIVIVDDIPSTIISSSCFSYRNNMKLVDMGNITVSGKFNLLPAELEQSLPLSISTVSESSWLPTIENCTSSGSVLSTEAKELVSNITLDSPVGCSPLYDAIVEVSKTLSEEAYDSLSKIIYTFIDDDVSCNEYTYKQAMNLANSIDGDKNVPVIISNLAITDAERLQPTLIGQINNKELNLISNNTGGNIITVYSNSSEYIDLLSGGLSGTVGYGTTEYVLDMKKEIVLRKVFIDFDIPGSHAQGYWDLSTSFDGYNYETIGKNYDNDLNLILNETSVRYLKFKFDLYNDLSSLDQPKILGADIYYYEPKVDYLFIDEINLSDNPNAVSVSVDSNIASIDGATLEIGLSNYNSTQWKDFDIESLTPIYSGGRYIIPVRSGKFSGISSKASTNPVREPLDSDDGYVFYARNGSWNRNATITVYSTHNLVIPSSVYITIPEKGMIIFDYYHPPAQNNYEGPYLSISANSSVKIAMKVKNTNVDSAVNIESLSINEVYDS